MSKKKTVTPNIIGSTAYALIPSVECEAVVQQNDPLITKHGGDTLLFPTKEAAVAYMNYMDVGEDAYYLLEATVTTKYGLRMVEITD